MTMSVGKRVSTLAFGICLSAASYQCSGSHVTSAENGGAANEAGTAGEDDGVGGVSASGGRGGSDNHTSGGDASTTGGRSGAAGVSAEGGAAGESAEGGSAGESIQGGAAGESAGGGAAGEFASGGVAGESARGGAPANGGASSDGGAPSSGGSTGVCVPGAQKCQNLQPQLCDDTGQWQDEGDPCPLICNAGTCTACEPDDKQCNGLQPQVCDADGSWQDNGTSCRYLCDQDTGDCTGTCVPQTRRCNDQQPQLCDDTGTWTDSGSACSQCSPCSASSGTCVTSQGIGCDDSNACTTGDTCQSNGNCVGGSLVTCPGVDQCHTVGSCVPASGCPAPVFKSGSCDDGNPCVINESCQSGTGQCGGGTYASITTSCGSNKYCDGQGACKCRTQSPSNILKNPGFNGAATDWTLQGTARYASEDVDACTGSGSVELVMLGDTFSQCLPASPNTTYYLAYRFRASGGSSSSGAANCYVSFLPADNTCSVNDGTAGFQSLQEFNNDNWISGSASGSSDSNTTHALVVCTALAALGYYDQLYLSATSPSVPAF